MQSKSELYEFLKADYDRNWGGPKDFSFFNVLKKCIKNNLFKYIVAMRLTNFAEENNRRFLLIFCKMKYRKLCIKYGIEIPYRTKCGKGLKISHGTGIVVNSEVAIGDYATLRNGVTLGISNGHCPVIGNDVEFGVGSVVIGDVVIGNHCSVGANAVVTHNVNDYEIVAGVPARVIGYNNDKAKL